MLIDSLSIDISTSLANVSQYITTDNLRLSPLQLAVAAAELTNGGQKVTPVLVTAYQSSDGNWNLLNSSAANQSIPNIDAPKTVDLLVQGNTPVWKTVAQVVDNKKTVSWYVAGTPSNWQGVPFALVIALEDNTAAQAELIGNQLINEIIVHD